MLGDLWLELFIYSSSSSSGVNISRLNFLFSGSLLGGLWSVFVTADCLIESLETMPLLAALFLLVSAPLTLAMAAGGFWILLQPNLTVYTFFSPFRVCRGVDEAGSADWRLQKDFYNHWCCMNGLLSSGNCESNSEVEMTSLMAARGISSWLPAPRSGLFMCFEKYNMGSYSSATD